MVNWVGGDQITIHSNLKMSSNQIELPIELKISRALTLNLNAREKDVIVLFVAHRKAVLRRLASQFNIDVEKDKITKTTNVLIVSKNDSPNIYLVSPVDEDDDSEKKKNFFLRVFQQVKPARTMQVFYNFKHSKTEKLLEKSLKEEMDDIESDAIELDSFEFPDF